MGSFCLVHPDTRTKGWECCWRLTFFCPFLYLASMAMVLPQVWGIKVATNAICI